jgi:hypothetical protein
MLKAGGGGGYMGLRCHNLTQRWLKFDGFDHELPRTSDTGLYVWVEVIGDDGDVDGQLMTVLMIGTGGDDAHAVDALHLRPFPGGRPELIVGPKAFDNRGFEHVDAFDSRRTKL